MTYVVTENCIKCVYTDCVDVCPVDCFHVGENFLVINPDDCIDCGVCEPECPAGAIVSDADPSSVAWLDINAQYSQVWPVIDTMRPAPDDADDWNGKEGKKDLLSENAGTP